MVGLVLLQEEKGYIRASSLSCEDIARKQPFAHQKEGPY